MPPASPPDSSQPHDARFKLAFGHPAHAAPVLQMALPVAIARHIDWQSLAPAPTELLDELLQKQHVDLLFQAKLAGRDAFLHVLFEHQRESHPLMPYRLLRYSVALWRMAAILHRVYRAEGGVEAVRSVLEYATRVAELDLEELEDYVERAIDVQEAETVMGMTSWQLIEKSKAEGKAEMLLRQLGKKFGPLPEATEKRVRSADPDRLDTWADQVMDAQSLDEALR